MFIYSVCIHLKMTDQTFQVFQLRISELFLEIYCDTIKMLHLKLFQFKNQSNTVFKLIAPATVYLQ